MPARTLPRAIPAPLLLLVLAVTTGWADLGVGRLQAVDAPPARPAIAAPGEEGERVDGFTTAIARSERDAETAATGKYAGVNRFWFPSLGINREVRAFACSRQRAPGNHVYRWGCAGRYNVYIMGHAYNVMEPLHDAYVRGELRVGLLAVYANAKGIVRRYRLTEWRVLDPADSSWAIAAQPVRSMTLQTCVGVDGQDRLVVRLVAVD